MNNYLSVWLTQLVKAFAAPTHVHSGGAGDAWFKTPEQTSSTLASIPLG